MTRAWTTMVGGVLIGATLLAAERQAPATKPVPLANALKDEIKASVDLGISYLRWKLQPNGSLNDDVAATAMAVRVFAESHRKYVEDDGPFVRQPVAFLRAVFGGDGSVGTGPRVVRDTALAVMALRAIGAEADRPLLEHSRTFLAAAIELAGSAPDPFEVVLVLEALDPLDPSRGLAVWSKAGALVAPNGGPALGVHVLAALHGLMLAKADRGDARVKSAMSWLRANYSVEANPGQGDRGRYHYYDTMANALLAYGERTIVDSTGAARDWRVELARAVIARQQFDGHWVNHDPYDGEDDPFVATALALHALEVLYSSRL